MIKLNKHSISRSKTYTFLSFRDTPTAKCDNDQHGTLHRFAFCYDTADKQTSLRAVSGERYAKD